MISFLNYNILHIGNWTAQPADPHRTYIRRIGEPSGDLTIYAKLKRCRQLYGWSCQMAEETTDHRSSFEPLARGTGSLDGTRRGMQAKLMVTFLTKPFGSIGETAVIPFRCHVSAKHKLIWTNSHQLLLWSFCWHRKWQPAWCAMWSRIWSALIWSCNVNITARASAWAR